MEKQIGAYTATGSAAFVEFCRFVIEDLQDVECLQWTPDCKFGFMGKYPEHIGRLKGVVHDHVLAAHGI